MDYSVMVAEDEMLVRAGIITLLRRCQPLVGETRDFANGAEAWEAFKQDPPDILLTDLRMGGLDGIALIERVREHDARCRVIVLTCVKDLGVMERTALLNITGYLFKLGLTQSGLENVLHKAARELEGHYPVYRPEKTNETNKDKLSLLLRDYIINNSLSPEVFARSLKKLSAPIRSSSFILCVAGVTLPAEADSILRDSVGWFLNKEIREKKVGLIFNDEAQRFIMLLNIGKDQASSLAESVNVGLRRYFNLIGVFVFIGPIKGYSQLPKAYRESVSSLERYGINDPVYWLEEEPGVCPEAYSKPIQKSLAYIEERYRSQITLTGVSEYLNLSPNYCSMFKRETNARFTDYVNGRRVREACHLLKSTSFDVSEVARRAGFADSAYFSKVFKKITGRSPGAYRSQKGYP